MPWYAFVMVALFAMNAGVTLAIVDRARKPLTAGVALAGLFVDGLVIWGVISLATT